MSLDIRYLTNGDVSVYTVRNAGVTPVSFDVYSNRDDIPQSIRHYAPTGEPVHCEPDLARIFGVLDLFYPNHPNCALPEYADRKCIADGCGLHNYAWDKRRGTCPRVGTDAEYIPHASQIAVRQGLKVLKSYTEEIDGVESSKDPNYMTDDEAAAWLEKHKDAGKE